MYDISSEYNTGQEDDEREPVVAFGAGMFGNTAKDHSPGPMKSVRTALRRRRIEVYDINEDYTSQLCNLCHEKVVPICSEGWGIAIFGVRYACARR